MCVLTSAKTNRSVLSLTYVFPEKMDDLSQSKLSLAALDKTD